MFLVNLSQRRKQARYQKIKQCAYKLFLVHLSYSIKKEIGIHVFYLPWRWYCIIWVMDMRQNISSGVSKSLLCKIQNKGPMHFLRDILIGHHKEKNEKYSIIVLRNGIHPRHMIYFGISILIQLCVCY